MLALLCKGHDNLEPELNRLIVKHPFAGKEEKPLV